MTHAPLPLDRILTGDCLEILQTLPPDSVDMVFADPPYNLQLSQELWRPNMTRVNGVDDQWDRFDSFEEYDAFTRAWLGASRRVLKPSGTLWVIGTYHNIYRVGKALQDLDFWILNEVVWIKANPMPNFRGVRFTNAHETLIWSQKVRGAPYTFNHFDAKALNDDLQMRSDWLLPLCTGSERIKANGAKAHAAQKPEALLYRVLVASTNPGDVVLDPFFGTGTTGSVAKKLSRHWIGIERDPGYVAIASQRLQGVQEPDAPQLVFATNQRRAQSRIPFGALLERGLLRPGQILYPDVDSQRGATILANGHIRYGDVTGSIHQVARSLHNAPCNGWDHWFYVNDNNGERVAIEYLRQLVRRELDSRR